jgi:tryptophan-rich sensory protein
MSERDFLRAAAACAALTAASGFLYSVVFIVFKDPGVAGLFLLLGGLLTIVTLAGLREIVAPAAHGGFIVNPAWYAWVGVAMYRLSGSAAR